MYIGLVLKHYVLQECGQDFPRGFRIQTTPYQTPPQKAKVSDTSLALDVLCSSQKQWENGTGNCMYGHHTPSSLCLIWVVKGEWNKSLYAQTA
jgi:hypothetical protein